MNLLRNIILMLCQSYTSLDIFPFPTKEGIYLARVLRVPRWHLAEYLHRCLIYQTGYSIFYLRLRRSVSVAVPRDKLYIHQRGFELELVVWFGSSQRKRCHRWVDLLRECGNDHQGLLSDIILPRDVRNLGGGGAAFAGAGTGGSSCCGVTAGAYWLRGGGAYCVGGPLDAVDGGGAKLFWLIIAGEYCGRLCGGDVWARYCPVGGGGGGGCGVIGALVGGGWFMDGG